MCSSVGSPRRLLLLVASISIRWFFIFCVLCFGANQRGGLKIKVVLWFLKWFVWGGRWSLRGGARSLMNPPILSAGGLSIEGHLVRWSSTPVNRSVLVLFLMCVLPRYSGWMRPHFLKYIAREEPMETHGDRTYNRQQTRKMIIIVTYYKYLLQHGVSGSMSCVRSGTRWW